MADRLIDVEINNGIDRDEYYKLKLTTPSFQQLFSRISGVHGSKTLVPAKWPWSVPADAVIFEEGNGGGQSFMFSPGCNTVYVYIWTV